MATSSTGTPGRASKSPVQKIRVAGTTATIWPNEGESGRVFYNTTVIRSYKDDADQYVKTNR